MVTYVTSSLLTMQSVDKVINLEISEPCQSLPLLVVLRRLRMAKNNERLSIAVPASRHEGELLVAYYRVTFETSDAVLVLLTWQSHGMALTLMHPQEAEAARTASTGTAAAREGRCRIRSVP